MDIDDLLARPGITQEARQYLCWLRDLSRRDPGAAAREMHKLWSADYEEVPVDLEKFCYDPYYLGYEGNDIWPRIFSEIVVPAFTLAPNGKPIIEVVLGGAIGWGKTKAASVIFCRMLYELMCLHSPHSFHGISITTPIALVNLSVSGKQAEHAFFAEVLATLDGSPYFRDHVSWDREDASYRKNDRKNVHLVCGNSTELSAIGLAVIGAAVDEANFLVGTKRSRKEIMANELDHAMTLYTAVKRRIKSRFLTSPRFPGKVMLMSSVQYPDDFLEMHLKDVAGDPQVLVCQYSQWATRRPGFFSGMSFFDVAVGAGSTMSKLLEPGEVPPMGTSVVHVPEVYRSDFEQDLEGSIRDIAGHATYAVTPFMHRRDLVHQRSEVNPELKHPWTAWSTNFQDGVQLIPELLARSVDKVRVVPVPEAPGITRKETTKVWQPLRDPGAPRYIHIDLALSGCSCGLAMGFCSGMVTRTRCDKGPDGTEVTRQVTLPYITFEALLEVTAPKNGEIVFGLVRDVVLQLRDLGFWIARVSFDQFQSKDSQQILTGLGFVTEQLSVDVDLTGYEALKSAIYEDRAAYYAHPTLLRELKALQRDAKTGRVDHPPRGTKDLSDAAAGVAYWVMKESASGSAPATPGPLTGQVAGSSVYEPEPDDPVNFMWLFGDGGRDGNPR